MKFNAWHYSDTNLWASLTAAILQGLAQALSEKNDPASQYARTDLQTKKEAAQNQLARAESDKTTAEAELSASVQRLQQLGTEVPPEHIVRDAFREAIKQPELASQIREAAKDLGVPDAADLKNVLLQARGVWDTFALIMRSSHRRNIWLLCAAMVLVVSMGVPVLAWAKAKGVGEWIATATGVLGASAALIGSIVNHVMRSLKLVDQVRQSAQEAVDKELQAKKNSAEEEHQELKAKAASALREVERASEVVSEIDRKLDDFRPDRQMSNFIRQRFQSADYTGQLGLISRARQDFEQLTTLLAQVRERSEHELKSGAKQELLLPRIDRIILYIDDLDRCPEEKVVDVLQAVHLLLAFKLFVVVVGVDPRWLLHSLTQHSTAFRDAGSGDANDASHWKSTPLNYLEKIFQIPFTLRPMEKIGFGKLLDSLTAGGDQDLENGEKQAMPALGVPAKLPGELVGGAGGKAAVVVKNIPMDSELLRIEEWERECMKELAELVPSPRAAKRFVNVYRLLRASIGCDRWANFIGDSTNGLYRPVLLLLAILTGYPAEATEILRAILEGRLPGPQPTRPTTTFWALIDEFEEQNERGGTPLKGGATADDPERWHELIDRLRGLRALVPEHQNCRDLVEYARQVARYSFQSGRILLTHIKELPLP